MQISYNTTSGLVQQAGESLGDLDGCTITDLSDEEAAKLLESGTKTWDPETRTITVTPLDTSAADAVAAEEHARLMKARADQARDHALILAKAKSDPVFAAVARQLGIPLEG